MEVTTLEVAEVSRVGEARRAVAQATRRLGFEEVRAGRAAIVVTELATNLVKHAGSGLLILQPLGGALPGLEVVSLDRGPGMRSLARSMEDGVSTAGSSGTGLGAMRRLSDVFDIFTRVGGGTAVVARLFARDPEEGAESRLRFGAVTVPKPGEEVCGDAWAVTTKAGGLRVLVVDGLGHGPVAREAAVAATASFQRATATPLLALEACHLALRGTRGAAAAVAEIDLAARQIRFAGLGNITGMTTSPEGNKSLVSFNGIVGQGAFRGREFAHPWAPGSTLVMCSDGITTRWSLAAYQGLLSRDPTLIAGVLFRDHNRDRDDATVVVVQEPAA